MNEPYDPGPDILAFNSYVLPWVKSPQVERDYVIRYPWGEDRLITVRGIEVAHRIDKGESLVYILNDLAYALALICDHEVPDMYEGIGGFASERMAVDHEQYTKKA